MTRPRRRRLRLACAAVPLVLVLAGCSAGGDDLDPAASGRKGDKGSGGGGGAVSDPSYAVDAPGRFEPPLRTADVLITGTKSLPASMVKQIAAVPGVAEVLPLSLASSSIEGRTLTVAAVDPAEFRRFTPEATARANFVWDRLAGGEVAVDLTVPKRLVGKGDMLRLSSTEDAPEVHVGAYAPLVKQIDAIVNSKRGEQLGIPAGNALLVSTGQLTPSELKDEFEAILGKTATLSTLALEFDLAATQTAVLTGSTVTEAVGTFTYTNRSNGEISPDPAWVAEYIRTEQVPILGSVTCNKGMLPQLRAALNEIVGAGLSSAIHPDEFAGCYYPRYIGRDPSNGLSLHSWGIAVDLNVPGNQRGTVGEMDRTVVQIFKKWGFAWGGDWSYTDPMHFEMARVVRPG